MRMLLVFLVACLIPICAKCADAPAKPNIVFVFADQWRACSTGYAGDPNVKTPNIDQLESQSVDFIHAVSTCPVCSPFRASLLTGQRATTHGVFLNDAHLSDDATSIGKVLDAAGYATGWIGKWHVSGRGRLSYIPPEGRQGFQYWKVCECTHDYNQSIYFGDTSQRLMWPGYDATAQSDDARKYIIDHARAGKPFALFLAWGPPHNPYGLAPKNFQQLYPSGSVQLRHNVPESSAESARKELAGYYANCSALDASLGDLRKTLHDAGIEQNTILVFTSDHGDMLGSHGMERKQKPWDESVRVPMLWHFPAALGDRGKRVDPAIASEDLMPTLLGLCNVPIPKSVEGLDYSGYLRGGANPNPDNAAMIESVVPFGEWNRLVGGREYRGVRTPRYTYVRDLKGPWLMYDNDNDPYQNQNIVNQPQSAQIQAQLDKLLDARLKAANDAFLPAPAYLDKWGYASRVDRSNTLPTVP